MTTWYVTTGTSLSDTARCWMNWDGDGYDLAEVDDLSHADFLARCPTWYEPLQTWRKDTFELPGGSEEEKRKWAADRVADHFRPECWDTAKYRSLPAELSTLYWMTGAKDGLKAGDTVCFITGRSNPAVAYLLVAMAEALQAAGKGLQDVEIEKSEVFALDPKTNEDFNKGLAALTRFLCDSGISEAGLVLTGGFKAVLVGLSIWLGNEGYLVPICHTHEDASDEVIRIEPQEQGPPKARRLERMTH